MRFSQFGGKEIIDVNSGERLGVINQSDLIIDPLTGRIESILLPVGRFWGKPKEELNIPWSSVRKIGSEMVIVQLKEREVSRE
ncbi:YlmC/YmxH family sporulation protein [Thermicanus aegyptius]|uniref:YlmC/YmxH family sporulation protein n=1 Tax=Thermicanus aegyptius TaxID=94009 RepID=UPI00048C9600|nr:YlmC/YmxH family sporulation protein [Thermicanus aegyptius]MBE3553678.1 YlmC/YmxH family sporulation protein [Thermicanus sp.]